MLLAEVLLFRPEVKRRETPTHLELNEFVYVIIDATDARLEMSIQE